MCSKSFFQACSVSLFLGIGKCECGSESGVPSLATVWQARQCPAAPPSDFTLVPEQDRSPREAHSTKQRCSCRSPFVSLNKLHLHDQFKFLKLVTNLPFKEVAGEADGAAGVPSVGGRHMGTCPQPVAPGPAGARAPVRPRVRSVLPAAQRSLDSCMFLCI